MIKDGVSDGVRVTSGAMLVGLDWRFYFWANLWLVVISYRMGWF